MGESSRPFRLLWVLCCLPGISWASVEPNLSAPWYILAHRYQAALEVDSDVTVTLEEVNEYHFSLCVDLDGEHKSKAEALATLLMPRHFDFGPVTVDVKVFFRGYPVEPGVFPSDVTSAQYLIADALEGNSLFVGIKNSPKPIFVFVQFYVIFQNRNLNYYSDDIRDSRGRAYEPAPYLLEDLLSLGNRSMQIGIGTPS